jgi:hypothetical protein
MTSLAHGHGGPHAYLTHEDDDPPSGPLTLAHGHGGDHAYVTDSQPSLAVIASYSRFHLMRPPKVRRFPDRPGLHALTMRDTKTGETHGRVEFYPHEDRLQIQLLSVPHKHRGNGYGGQVMDELQRRYPDHAIDHGERTEAGDTWWDSYTRGKEVTRGRTAGADLDGGQRRALDRLAQEPEEMITGERVGSRRAGRANSDTKPRAELPALSRFAFMPTKRLFGPTYGLDKRLFNGDKLKPDVRKYILETLAEFWKPRHGVNWDEWAIVYLAGSEASEWTSETFEGNGDFDVLIGVDYEKYRKNCSRTDPAQQMSDEEITAELNAHLKKLTAKTDPAWIWVEGVKTGPWSNTWYVNQDSYDIRKIKPYAAYDVSHNRWAVKPPHLPEWDISQFPEGPALVAECQAVSAYVRAILNMPEPYRTQQGYALWHHLHSDRSRAFSEQGEGWYDPGNVIEKWLDQEGLWEKLVEIMVRVKHDPSAMDAPKDWSNNPG